MNDHAEMTPEQRSALGRVIGFCLDNKLVVGIVLVLVILAGLVVAPFDWSLGPLPRRPVPVDAIPDLGENQQIVFTDWPGHSPQDVEDQLTYPLTVALLGLPQVKTIRSNSYFGFSSIYVVFREGVDFYWARARLVEKLNGLPPGTLPTGVQPRLGPDATALGQVFWYTLEGRNPRGEPAGGWDLEELRTIQDWTVRYGLQSAEGVSEVASVGGFVRQYQVDVNPDALRAYDVTITDVYRAIQASNIDVGAKTIELNRVEYLIRGIGFVRSVDDLRKSVITTRDHTPILVEHVAHVTTGPALRRGALDKGGAEAVGGVVVVRYGENPLAVIKNVKAKIAEIAPALPIKAVVDYGRTGAAALEAFARRQGFEPYADGRLNQAAWIDVLRRLDPADWPRGVDLSQVEIVPFYDRTGLIYETLGTLDDAITQQILVTVIVVVVLVLHLRTSLLISAVLPLAVFLAFIAMKVFGVDANVVALSGIAIAIGTMVDMGIVICEAVLRQLEDEGPDADSRRVVHRAASEVGGAVLTAVLTTVVSFLPVLTMTGAEGKLFRPLALTKTFALIGAMLVALLLIPPAAQIILAGRVRRRVGRVVLGVLLLGAAVAAGVNLVWWVGVLLAAWGLYVIVQPFLPALVRRGAWLGANLAALLVVTITLALEWEPVGAGRGAFWNVVFVALLLAVMLALTWLFLRAYPTILRWCLAHKGTFLVAPAALVCFGLFVWLGFDRVAGFLPRQFNADMDRLRSHRLWVSASHTFPGLGREFMPPLDEGSFLYMPTTMVHASIGEALDVLSKQDMAFASIPEIDLAVGKIGRVDSALDPAPISMIETIINYVSEYRTDAAGRRLTFRYDEAAGQFARDNQGQLIPDPDGRPYRQWRDHIRTPDDIWQEILAAGKIVGVTSAPKLQPIAARLVMLQSGMRAPMGIKVRGPSLAAIEKAALALEAHLKDAPGVAPETVIADRIVGKPYLEIVPDRAELARYGVSIRAFQEAVEVAIGGKIVTQTVEGRERFGVRVRYQRELRDQIETMRRILVAGMGGAQVPLEQVATIRYVRGPQMIRSEDTFLTAYVLFDKQPDRAEVDVVEACQRHLQALRDRGELMLPEGVSYVFAGNYQNQLRAQRTLAVILPVTLIVVFLLLYLHFHSVLTTALVFTGVLVAWSGGFVWLWLYGQDWFLNASPLGLDLRTLFQVHPINLSVAVWVGFLALFGIATDDGVVMATYLESVFRNRDTSDRAAVREATLAAGQRRVRACVMTTATTVLALLPVLTATGRGADIMVPMALPVFGGMVAEVLTMLVVPVLYCAAKEHTEPRRANG